MSVSKILQSLQSIDLGTIFPSVDTTYSSKYSYTNHAPSESEMPLIHDVVSQRKEQINDIDTVVERVETLLLQLQLKRERILSSMKAHESFTSWIRRLPLDILKEIFLWCLPEQKHLNPNRATAPLLLTRICRSWREVALDTPRLWASLSILESERGLEELLGLYHQYWLANTRLCSLSLGVCSFPRLDAGLWRSTATDIARRYTARCMELTVYLTDPYCLGQLLEDVPLLERLNIAGDLTGIEQKISITQPHPRLRTLALLSIDFQLQDLTIFDPAWTNLTRLAVVLESDHHDVDERVFLALLQICPNLEHFVLAPVPYRKYVSPVSLNYPKLRILDIMEFYGDGPCLGTLTLPNLHHLRFRQQADRVNDVFEDTPIPDKPPPESSGHRILTITIQGHVPNARTFFTVFDPDWTKLTHLRLNGSHTEETAFILPLQLCPRLEDIIASSITIENEIRYSPLIHPVLRSLTVVILFGPTDTLLDILTLPGLVHLDLTLPKLADWPHTEFKKFLTRSKCPLETLKIRLSRISIQHREDFASLIPTLICLDVYYTTKHRSDELIYSWSRC